MRKTSSTGVRHYYQSGVQCALPLATIALHHGIRFDAATKVLDFGCGAGRQLLHFTRRFPDARFHACDLDHTLIDFIRSAYPQVDSLCTGFHPPLPYRDGEMDLIYSVSTFSHIDPAFQMPWLLELYRVMRPGGICLLTTEGFTAFPHLNLHFGSDLRTLLRGGLLFHEYPFLQRERDRKPLSANTARTVGVEGSYGATVMTPEYIRREWPASGFEVVDVVEGIIDSRQDLVILRRKGAERLCP